jgi:hypothetical protein
MEDLRFQRLASWVLGVGTIAVFVVLWIFQGVAVAAIAAGSWQIVGVVVLSWIYPEPPKNRAAGDKRRGPS